MHNVPIAVGNILPFTHAQRKSVAGQIRTTKVLHDFRFLFRSASRWCAVKIGFVSKHNCHMEIPIRYSQILESTQTISSLPYPRRNRVKMSTHPGFISQYTCIAPRVNGNIPLMQAAFTISIDLNPSITLSNRVPARDTVCCPKSRGD